MRSQINFKIDDKYFVPEKSNYSFRSQKIYDQNHFLLNIFNQIGQLNNITFQDIKEKSMNIKTDLHFHPIKKINSALVCKYFKCFFNKISQKSNHVFWLIKTHVQERLILIEKGFYFYLSGYDPEHEIYPNYEKLLEQNTEKLNKLNNELKDDTLLKKMEQIKEKTLKEKNKTIDKIQIIEKELGKNDVL